MTDFRIKCVTHDQVGVCKDEITPVTSSSCEPVISVPPQDWTVSVTTSSVSASLFQQTRFAQICNEIHLSFLVSITDSSIMSTTGAISSLLLIPPLGITISNIVPWYDGVGHFSSNGFSPDGVTLLPRTGRLTAHLDSTPGPFYTMNIFLDSWIQQNAPFILANSPFTIEGSIVFYLA